MIGCVGQRCGLALCVAGVVLVAGCAPVAQQAGVPLQHAVGVEGVDAQTYAKAINGPAHLWVPGEPNVACFDSSAPINPEILAQVDALMRAGLPKYQLSATNGRWTTTATNGSGIPIGTPITVTWSLVPDGIRVSPTLPPPTDGSLDPQRSRLFERLDAQFGGNRSLWLAQFQAAFDRWSELSGITFVRVQSGANPWDDGAVWGTGGNTTSRGDIRIGMRPIDVVGNVLAFNSYPNNGDMVLDFEENWGQSANTYRFLRNIVMHELGHGQGIAHNCPVNQLGSGNRMLLEPSYSAVFDGPQQDDIRAVQENYGDAAEPNGTPATATLLGDVTPGSTQTFGTVSTASSASRYSLIFTDEDYFKFTTTVPLVVSIAATPVGTTYLTGDCTTNPSGTSVNASNIGDLLVEVYNVDGSVSYGVQNTAAIGVEELVANVLFPAGGGMFRVRSAASLADTQLYTVRLEASSAIAFSSSNTAGPVVLTWGAVTGNTGYRVYRSATGDRASATLISTQTGTSLTDTASTPAAATYWVETNQAGRPNTVIGGPLVAAARPACGLSDVAGPGQSVGPDNTLTADDIIVFLNWFFASDTRADVAGPGQSTSADGQFTADDIIVFLNRFFAGC